jgi:lysyl-tRNA synthetase class 2
MSSWRPTTSIATLAIRAQMLRAAREYFTATRTLEVETPTLARAAVTDVHLASVAAVACREQRYLHTSPEYAMKRLLAAGSGDIWQIARVYRDEETGRWHNPEFTMIEWYRVGVDHHELMNDVERLIAAMLPPSVAFDRSERMTYRDAVQLHSGVDPLVDSTEMLCAALANADIDIPSGIENERDALLDLLMSVVVGPRLGQERLTFIYDYPASQAALARVRGPVASRFEAYWRGVELANGFHELADATEQRRRFEQDLALRKAKGLSMPPIDEHFLGALEHGIPECSGVALGFDRLVMCVVGATHIEEVIAFPFGNA